MVVKSQLKYIKSLHQKKYRNVHKSFIAEGEKIIIALLEAGMQAEIICSTDPGQFKDLPYEVAFISLNDLKKVSALKNPNTIIGVFKIPDPQPIDYSDWVLALDRIQDPGNLGTIIRLCDWFGIKQIICSRDTVDAYNPKVLQATMGSLAGINLVYEDLLQVLSKAPLAVYGTYMEGESIYKATLPEKGILVMGNEAKGISEKVGKLIDYKLTIPAYSEKLAESLNVATATAIILSELRRA